MDNEHRTGSHASAPTRGSADTLTGTRVGAVDIESCVYEGELARVYRGQRDGQQVAVKVYRADLPEEAHTGRIEREREAQREVTHPCVASLVDWGRLPSAALYLVSEWVPGERLEDRLARGPIPWPELKPLLAALAKGLRAVHAAGIVHRDVKPSNIMLPETGRPPAVLLDFGHSLMLDEQRLTDRGWTLGSAAYMAPEQARGTPLDGRTDLYALGVVLYRALTGVLPFDAESAAEVMSRHQRDPVIPPSERAPQQDIPEVAEQLCMWLLTKDPNRRVPNAQVLIVTLQSAEHFADSRAGRVA